MKLEVKKIGNSTGLILPKELLTKLNLAQGQWLYVTELPDGLEIIGGSSLIGAEVDSDTDHRIAMSLAIAALVAKGTTTIHRAEAAAVSYPTFVSTLQQVCGDL